MGGKPVRRRPSQRSGQIIFWSHLKGAEMFIACASQPATSTQHRCCTTHQSSPSAARAPAGASRTRGLHLCARATCRPGLERAVRGLNGTPCLRHELSFWARAPACRRPDSRVSGEEHSAPSPPEPLHSLAAWQQQADSLGRQLAMPSASLAVPQPQGCAAAPLPSCGLLPLGAHEQPVARQHAGNEHSVSSLPSMHQRGQGQLLGGLLPSLVMAGTMPGGLVTAACPAEGPRAGGIAGAGAEALGMLPTSQAASAAAAQNPYSAAGLLLGRGLAAGVAACPSSSAWPMPAAIMAAASPPAAAAQQPPLQLDPSASLPGAGQHTLQASFAWGSLGLAPQLCMRGGQQDAARWPPLTLAPASLAAAAPGTVSHHSTSRASAGSLGGSDDTPSIGPAHGPAVGRQGRQEHSEGGAASGASGSAACSEGAGRSVEPATFQERPGSAAMLAGMVGVPPTMQHKLSGFSSSGLLPPQQQCWVPPHGGGGGGAPLPGWLHGLQLGGAGASGLLSTVDASAMWQPGARATVQGTPAWCLGMARWGAGRG